MDVVVSFPLFFKLIIVLGGGLTDLGEPHDFVKARLDMAVKYFKPSFSKILLASRGTPHKPPPIKEGEIHVLLYL